MLAGERPFRGADGHAAAARDPDRRSASDGDVVSRRARRHRSRAAPGAREGTAISDIRRWRSWRRNSSALGDAVRTIGPPVARLGGLGDSPARMSTTERRRAAVLVTVVSDYAALVDQNAAGRRASCSSRGCATRRSTSFGRTAGWSTRRSAKRSCRSSACRSAHDDDDLRAVRAALELHARIRALNGPMAVRRQAERPIRPARRPGRRTAPARRTAPLRHRRRAGDDGGTIGVDRRPGRRVGQPGDAAAGRALHAHGGVRVRWCSMSQAGPVTPFRVLGETGIATRLEASSRTGLTPYVGRQSELSTAAKRT